MQPKPISPKRRRRRQQKGRNDGVNTDAVQGSAHTIGPRAGAAVGAMAGIMQRPWLGSGGGGGVCVVVVAVGGGGDSGGVRR